MKTGDSDTTVKPVKKTYIPVVAKPKTNTSKGSYEPPSSSEKEKKSNKKFVSKTDYGIPEYGADEQGQGGPYRVTHKSINSASAAASAYARELAKSGQRLTGYDRRMLFLENMEPYMGDYGVMGNSYQYPGVMLDSAVSPVGSGGYYEEPLYYGGGGGGGGYTPAKPPEMKIRTATGQRRSPYWSSEDPFIGGFEPRFVVLGDTGQW
jgi:hypothetical protein